MYVVIESGSKQYRVKEGDELNVELLDCRNDAEKNFKFDKVLLIDDGKNPIVGLPYVLNWAVHAEVLREVKGPKVIAYKYRKRKKSRRLVGHRQKYTRVKITKIIAA
ncbi:MAG: 50S ribosomal protein L21 [Chlamydiae bacterium]|nr:50S ribosomal protein L21 [Chlamydiota bacterium]